MTRNGGPKSDPANVDLQRISEQASYLDRVMVGEDSKHKGGDKNRESVRYEEFLETSPAELRERIKNREPIWGFDRNRLNSMVAFILLEFQRREDRQSAKLIEKHVWNDLLQIRCDWFALLHDLVEGRRGLADELLAQLNRGREPSLGHVMLAHLTKRLGWRLLLRA